MDEGHGQVTREEIKLHPEPGGAGRRARPLPVRRIGCLGCLGLMAVAVASVGIRSGIETHRAQEAAQVAADEAVRQREGALQEARTASEPAAIVAAYERILPPSAEPSDKARFGSALAMLADTEEDLARALELYQRASGVVALTEAQETRRLTLTEAVRAASRREHLQSAREDLDGAKANRANPAIAVRLYREAASALEAAKSDGATPRETSAMERQAAAGVERSECDMGAALREVTASELQTSMWSQGIDATIRTSEKCKTAIRIDWILWSNPAVYAFQNGEIPGALRAAGFKSIRLTAWDTYWTIEL